MLELMVVLGILGILIGLLIPSLKLARGRAIKTTCLSNLRQIGIAVEIYKNTYGGRFPKARYMGDPFLSTDTDPPFRNTLHGVLNITAADTTAGRVFKCPGDAVVFPLSSMSSMYQSELSGLKLDERLARVARRLRLVAGKNGRRSRCFLWLRGDRFSGASAPRFPRRRRFRRTLTA